jgi:hypothetical protein
MRQTRRTNGLWIAARRTRSARIARIARIVAIAGLILWAPRMTMRAQQDPDQLQQLVAPIALYPDDLAAEVLAAATYPAQVDEAAHWLQQNASLTADQIASGADRMDWDSSVKALTEFPVVLTMMDQNLSWTSALGDAYFNQPDDVMDAVQVLRERAIAAGTLQSNSQITVSTQDGIIVIEPASADTEYVPSYDSWSVFGAPIDPWPEFVVAPGFVAGPRVRWDLRFNVSGQWGHVNWGLHNWQADWSTHRVNYRREAYVSHSPSVVDRHYVPRPAAPPRGAGSPRPETRVNPAPPGGGRVSGRGPAEPAPVRTNPGAPAGGRAPAEPAPPPVDRRANPGAAAVGQARGRGPAPTNPEPVRPQGPTNAQPIRPALPIAAPKPVEPPKAPANAKSDRGFPQPKPPSPPSGTKSSAFTAINHGGVTSNNANRGQTSLGVRQAQPKPAAPPKPPPAPAPGKGRGRGGL